MSGDAITVTPSSWEQQQQRAWLSKTIAAADVMDVRRCGGYGAW